MHSHVMPWGFAHLQKIPSVGPPDGSRVPFERSTEGAPAPDAPLAPALKLGSPLTFGGLKMKAGVRAYAKHRQDLRMQGGTPAAVRKALERGQITRDSRGKINVAEADAAWPADMAMGPELEGGTEGEPTGGTDAISFTEARRLKEVALARLRQLEVAEREGGLISIDDALAYNTKIYSALRAILLAIPGKYPPRFVGATNYADAQRRLSDMVHEIMVEMSEMDDPDEAEAA